MNYLIIMLLTEIRLQDALNEELLCPFYYFGITDFEKMKRLTETTQLQQLVSQERVDFVNEKVLITKHPS